MIIHLGDETRAEVIDSVLGQLSDGIWENSSAMDKYWMFADVEGTDLVIDDEPFRDEKGWGRYGSTIKRTQNGFAGKSEKQIKDWFANKAKQVVKIWAEDHNKDPNAIWDRANDDDIVNYMGHHRVPTITVADVYECYDFLKGRAGKKYGIAANPLPYEVKGSSDVDNTNSDKEYYYQSKFPKSMVDALYDAGYLKKPWTAISPDQSVFNAMSQAAVYSSDESLLSYMFSYNDEYGSRYLDKRFAMNDNVPEYILRDLYTIYSDGTIRGDYDELLVYIIKNPNTPLDIVQALANSDSRLVRSNAEAELNKQ